MINLHACQGINAHTPIPLFQSGSLRSFTHVGKPSPHPTLFLGNSLAVSPLPIPKRAASVKGGGKPCSPSVRQTSPDLPSPVFSIDFHEFIRIIRIIILLWLVFSRHSPCDLLSVVSFDGKLSSSLPSPFSFSFLSFFQFHDHLVIQMALVATIFFSLP